MAQGQWVKMGADIPVAPKEVPPLADDAEKEQVAKHEALVEKYEAAYEKFERKDSEWAENNSKAVGNILLRLHPSISFQMREIATAEQLWKRLEEKYGKPGPSVAYIEFRKALNLSIPAQADPSLALDALSCRCLRQYLVRRPID